MNEPFLNNTLLTGQRILEHAPDGIFMINFEMKIEYVNPAFCKMLGYTPEEVIGTLITDHLGDISILANCMQNVQETGSCVDQETIFRRKNGSMIHISKNVQAMKDANDQLMSIVVFIRDMTRLHFLNSELMDSQTKLQEYVNNLKYLVEDRTKELSEQLYVDALTRLPNRRKLLVDLTEDR